MNIRRGLKEKYLGIAFCSLLFLLGNDSKTVFAEVIAVEQEPKSFFGSTPTMTMFWPATEPKATIVVLLGGGGAAVKKGGHAWFGKYMGWPWEGKEIKGISCTDLMWEFFKTHPKR